MFLSSLRTSIISFFAFTLLLGVIYPAVSTGLIQVLFHDKANGSLIKNNNGKVVGSSLIGQQFNDPKYFWGRLSATGPVPYNAAASSGSNLGAASTALETNVKARMDALKKHSTANDSEQIPVDLVTASASGLDPDISLAAAYYQMPRIAQTRGVPESQIKALIEQHTQGRQWGVLGEPRVNVLSLNFALESK